MLKMQGITKLLPPSAGEVTLVFSSESGFALKNPFIFFLSVHLGITDVLPDLLQATGLGI